MAERRGYQLRLLKAPYFGQWRLVGTRFGLLGTRGFSITPWTGANTGRGLLPSARAKQSRRTLPKSNFLILSTWCFAARPARAGRAPTEGKPGLPVTPLSNPPSGTPPNY